MKDNVKTGPSGKKRALGIGTGVIAGMIAGGGAMLLSPAHAAAPSAAAPPAAAAAPAATATTPPVLLKPLATAAVEDSDQAARDAFYAAGYTYDDAVALAKAWHSDDPFEVKATAGKKLEAGETLAIEPGSSKPAPPPAATKDDIAVNKFFAAGYTYDDAVALAKKWGSANPYEAKVAAGNELLDGQKISVAR